MNELVVAWRKKRSILNRNHKGFELMDMKHGVVPVIYGRQFSENHKKFYELQRHDNKTA